MKWNKKEVPIAELSHLNEQLARLVQEGASNLDNIRLVFRVKDDPTIHLLTIFDWLDNPFESSGIALLYIYQPLESSG